MWERFMMGQGCRGIRPFPEQLLALEVVFAGAGTQGSPPRELPRPQEGAEPHVQASHLETTLFPTGLCPTPRPSQCVSFLQIPRACSMPQVHTASSGDSRGAFWKTHFPGGNCHCSYRSGWLEALRV